MFLVKYIAPIQAMRGKAFFQFSENALDVLFPETFGMHCVRKGCSNLIEGRRGKRTFIGKIKLSGCSKINRIS